MAGCHHYQRLWVIIVDSKRVRWLVVLLVAGECNAIGMGVENERGESEGQNGIILVDMHTHAQLGFFKVRIIIK